MFVSHPEWRVRFFARAVLLASVGLFAVGGVSLRAQPPDPKPDEAKPLGPWDGRPPDIVPTKLADGAEITLPGVVRQTCLGGNGRYVCFVTPKEKCITVLDVCEGKTKRVELPEEEVRVAAGNTALFVYAPKANTVERYSLATLQKEATVPYPLKDPPLQLLMGHASNGPLYATGPNAVLDPKTLKEIPLRVIEAAKLGPGAQPGAWFQRDPKNPPYVRISADGRVLATYWETLVVGPTGATRNQSRGGGYGPMQPGPDGNLFTYSGIYTPEFKSVEFRSRLPWSYTLIPGAHGPMYLSIRTDANLPVNQKPLPRLFLQLAGDARPLAELSLGDRLELPDNFADPRLLHPFERLFLVPEARALVALNKPATAVRVWRADLDDLLARTDADFLVVTSRPPRAVPGTAFTYKPTVKAKRDRLTFALEAAPKGMTVADDGTITWGVPKDWTGPATATLVVSDATRQEVPHAFEVVKADGADGGAAVAVQAGPNPHANARVVPVNRPRFVFPPVAPVEIKPAPLDQAVVEVPLPGKVYDAVAAGGGRYWLFQFADPRQIALFDVNEAKITRTAALAGGAVVAAGMNKLFVAYPDAGVIVRYDLATLRKEVAVKLPFDGTVTNLAMGSASSGPLLVRYTTRGKPDNSAVVFLDPTTFRLLELGYDPHGYPRPGYGPGWHYRADPDGRTFVGWAYTNGAPAREVLTVADSGIQKGGLDEETFPGAGGVLLGKTRVWAGGVVRVASPKGEFYRVPSQSGPFYLGRSLAGRFDDAVPRPLELYGYWSDRPLAALKDVKLASPPPRVAPAENFDLDARHFFCPDASVLGVVTGADDKLTLYKLDIDALLAQSGGDYLFVTGRPPAAETGRPFRYPIAVKSKAGGVAFKLDTGPDGMTVAPDGAVAWAVPKDWAEPVGVVARIADKSGQEVFHSFVLAPYVPGAVAVAPKPVAPKPVPAPPLPAGPKVDVVRAAANPAKLTPTKVADAVELKLPAPADAVCLGGNGRYVIYRVPKSKVAVVLDVSEGRFVKNIPIQEEGTLIAAGNEHLYLISPKANVIVRWNLVTLKKEATYPNPYDAAPHAALMGHAADGPLLLVGPGKGGDPGFVLNALPQPSIGVGAGGIGLVDGLTGKAVEWPAGAPGGLASVVWSRGSHPPLSVSGDGRVYGVWKQDGGEPQSVVFGPEGARTYALNTPGGPLLAFPSGAVGTRRGLYTPDLKPLGDTAALRGEPLPAAHGRLYLTYQIPAVFAREPRKTVVEVRTFGEERSLGDLSDLAGLGIPTDPDYMFKVATKLLPWERIFLVPDVKVLAALDEACEKVTLHRVDPDKLLADAKFDVLLVASQPPPATRGAVFTYKPAVLSKKGGVKVALDGGPLGMALAADGTLTWAVPDDFAGESTFVILTITDAAGQEALHAFPLPVGARR